jgi:isoquinoline 1-oxidoreductase beta subunit
MKFIKNDHLTPELPDFFQELAGKRGFDNDVDNDVKFGITDVSRRQFFKISGIAGGGLVLGLAMGSSPKAKAQSAANLSTISPYVQIQPNGRINLFSKNPECGQGIKTGLPLIIAEELDCAWEDVDVVQDDIDATKYGS